jgi:hypothetical protein
VNAYHQWTASDWAAHYAPPSQAAGVVQASGAWGADGQRVFAYASGESLSQTAEHLLQRGQQAFENVTRSASHVAHEGIQAATAPKTLLFGLAAFGIFAWVVVQSGRTAGKTIVGVAPHAAKALPLLI